MKPSPVVALRRACSRVSRYATGWNGDYGRWCQMVADSGSRRHGGHDRNRAGFSRIPTFASQLAVTGLDNPVNAAFGVGGSPESAQA